MKELSSYIDHTLLAADATPEQIKKLCSEAVEHNFCSVCVNSSFVPLAKECLKDSAVKVCTVVGFPLGAMATEAKAYETKLAIDNGAEEIDMVIHLGQLKSGNDDMVRSDIEAVRKASMGKVLKVIIETALLNDEEKIKACQIAKEAGADFVKTSTGFSSGGATLDDVRLMKQTIGDSVQVKASGGIRDTQTALAMIEAGASRLGVSAGVAIVEGLRGLTSNDFSKRKDEGY